MRQSYMLAWEFRLTLQLTSQIKLGRLVGEPKKFVMIKWSTGQVNCSIDWYAYMERSDWFIEPFWKKILTLIVQMDGRVFVRIGFDALDGSRLLPPTPIHHTTITSKVATSRTKHLHSIYSPKRTPIKSKKIKGKLNKIEHKVSL